MIPHTVAEYLLDCSLRSIMKIQPKITQLNALLYNHGAHLMRQAGGVTLPDRTTD